MSVASAQEKAEKAQEAAAGAMKRPSSSIDTVSSVAGTLLRPKDAAGEIFGVPVSMNNYYFAKRVAYMFPRPWGAADLTDTKEKEAIVWESLILHYESFQRGITVTDDQLDTQVNEFLKSQSQTFTRRGDPTAYARWATGSLQEDVQVFENQVRYLVQIQMLKDRAREEQQVEVTEAQMVNEYLNEKHHVGGEMIVFETKAQAQDAYERFKDPKAWDAMKQGSEFKVRPVSMMTLEAYIDLWSVPKDQMYALHDLELGTVAPPMPFGRQWCVYRLLDKRTGDLKDFPKERESYRKQMEVKNKYEALQRWMTQLKESAHLKIFVPPEAP